MYYCLDSLQWTALRKDHGVLSPGTYGVYVLVQEWFPSTHGNSSGCIVVYFLRDEPYAVLESHRGARR